MTSSLYLSACCFIRTLFFPFPFLFFSHCQVPRRSILVPQSSTTRKLITSQSTGAGCPVVSGIYISCLFAHSWLGIIALWISESGKHKHAETHTFTNRSLQLNIHGTQCDHQAFLIQRNDQHCHSRPVLPYAENAKQRIITSTV